MLQVPSTDTQRTEGPGRQGWFDKNAPESAATPVETPINRNFDRRPPSLRMPSYWEGVPGNVAPDNFDRRELVKMVGLESLLVVPALWKLEVDHPSEMGMPLIIPNGLVYATMGTLPRALKIYSISPSRSLYRSATLILNPARRVWYTLTAHRHYRGARISHRRSIKGGPAIRNCRTLTAPMDETVPIPVRLRA